jgi:hypothetical protein
LSSERHGDRDQIVVYFEAVVSAYQKGTWVADLDLFDLFQNIGQIVYPNSPFHYLPIDWPHRPVAKVDSSTFDGLTSIDNWYDYLDRPTNATIIRANNNWVVRLAFAAIPFPDREKLIIGSQEICWPAQNVLLRIQAYRMTNGFF